MSNNSSSFDNLMSRSSAFGSGFIMLSENIYALMFDYISNGRSRVPPEYVLGELIPTFQDGAKTDRRALQSKFKSWSKRMEIKEQCLILASSEKLILPRERCDSVILDLHMTDHCCVDDLVMRIQEKYTWSRKNFGMDWDIVIDGLTSICRRKNCLDNLAERLSRANYFSRPILKPLSYECVSNSDHSKTNTSLLNTIKISPPSYEDLSGFNRIELTLPNKVMSPIKYDSDDESNLSQNLSDEHANENIENRISLRPQLYPNGLPLSPILKEEHVVVKSKKLACTSARDFLKSIERKTQNEETLKCIKEEKTQFLASLNLVPLKYCPRKKILTRRQRLTIKQQMLKRRSLLQRSGMGRYNLRHIKEKKSKANRLNYERFQERLHSGYYSSWNSLRRKKRTARLSSYAKRMKPTKKKMYASDSDKENFRKKLRMKSNPNKKMLPEVIDIISSSDEEQQVPASPPMAIKQEDGKPVCEDKKPWCYDQYMFGPTLFHHVTGGVPSTTNNTFTKFSTNAPRMASFVNPSQGPYLHKFESIIPPFRNVPGNSNTNPAHTNPVHRFWNSNPENATRNQEHVRPLHPWNLRIPNMPNGFQVVRVPSDAKFLFLQSHNRLPGTLIRMPSCRPNLPPPRMNASQQRFSYINSRFRNLAPKPEVSTTPKVVPVSSTATATSTITPNPEVSCQVGSGKADVDQKTENESELKTILAKPQEPQSNAKLSTQVRNKISLSWNEKASNLSRLIHRLKSNFNPTVFQSGKEKNIDRITTQLEVGIALVKESRKSLVELEKSQEIKKED